MLNLLGLFPIKQGHLILNIINSCYSESPAISYLSGSFSHKHALLFDLFILFDLTLHFKNFFSSFFRNQQKMLLTYLMHILKALLKFFLFHKKSLPFSYLWFKDWTMMLRRLLHKLEGKVLSIKDSVLGLFVSDRVPWHIHKCAWRSDCRISCLSSDRLFCLLGLWPSHKSFKMICGRNYKFSPSELQIWHIFK